MQNTEIVRFNTPTVCWDACRFAENRVHPCARPCLCCMMLQFSVFLTSDLGRNYFQSENPSWNTFTQGALNRLQLWSKCFPMKSALQPETRCHICQVELHKQTPLTDLIMRACMLEGTSVAVKTEDVQISVPDISRHTGAKGHGCALRQCDLLFQLRHDTLQ